ncbi:ubiquitin-like-specific protease 1 [Sipha flava]|nr:ubiquitin-like-specific protease 1 [Sipha flava]
MLIPVILDRHYMLVSVYLKTGRIVIYDSLKGNSIKVIGECIKSFMESSDITLKETKWVVVNGECPVQTNDFDCGPWVCAMGLCLAKSINFWFTQGNMQDLRKDQASSIESNSLVEKAATVATNRLRVSC